MESESKWDVWLKLSPKELEAQYSPSKWSKRYGEEEVIAKHVEAARRRSEEARTEVESRCGVVYGSQEWKRGKLDVYGENLDGEAPILVYVHGGYWQELDKDLSAYLVKPLYKNGIVCVVVGYDLAPSVTIKDILKEIRSAVMWACTLARGRGSTGVVLAGWSAGAQLVTQVLSEVTPQDMTSFDLVRGVVTLSGIFDLRPLVSTYVNAPLKLTNQTAWELSPHRSVSKLGNVWAKSGLRVLVAVGENDSQEFKRQSKAYCEACQKVDLQAEFHLAGNVDHFDLVCDLALHDYPLTSKLVNFTLSACDKEGLNKED